MLPLGIPHAGARFQVQREHAVGERAGRVAIVVGRDRFCGARMRHGGDEHYECRDGEQLGDTCHDPGRKRRGDGAHAGRENTAPRSAAPERIHRPAQQPAKRRLVEPARDDLRAIAQPQHERRLAVPFQRIDRTYVHDRGPAHANEIVAPHEPLSDAIHGGAREIGVARAVHAHMIAGTLEAVYGLDLNEGQPVAFAHDEPVRQRCRLLFRSRHHLLREQSLEALRKQCLTLKCEQRLRPIERLAQTRRVHRLEHVVHGVHLERFHGVLVVGRDEHDHRHRLDADLLDDLECRRAAELHVQQHHVGAPLHDRRDGLIAAAALAPRTRRPRDPRAAGAARGAPPARRPR